MGSLWWKSREDKITEVIGALIAIGWNQSWEQKSPQITQIGADELIHYGSYQPSSAKICGKDFEDRIENSYFPAPFCSAGATGTDTGFSNFLSSTGTFCCSWAI